MENIKIFNEFDLTDSLFLNKEQTGKVPLENFVRDLNSPLSEMYLSLQLIEKSNYSPQTVERHIQQAKTNWFRIMKILNDIYLGQKLVDNEIKVNVKNHDIVAMLKKIISSSKSLTTKRKISLFFSSDSSEKIVAIDKEIVERILLNFLASSFKRVKENGYVHIEIHELDGEMVITIFDSGFEVNKDLFLYLFNQKNTTKEENVLQTFWLDELPKGLLWTPIVKQLSTLINANISFKASETGTKTYLTFPAYTVEQVGVYVSNYDDFYQDNICQIELSDYSQNEIDLN